MIVENRTCEGFLEKNSLKKVAEEGLKTFQSKEKRANLLKEYELIGKKVFAFIESQKDLASLTPEQLMEILKQIKQMFESSVGTYFLTEPETTIKVAKEMNDLEWVPMVAKARFKLRKAWSSLVNWTEETFFRELGKRLNIDSEIISHFLFEELVSKNPKDSSIAQRRMDLFVCQFEQNVKILSVEKKDVNNFRKTIFKSSGILTGSPVYHGYTVGNVIVCSFEKLEKNLEKLKNLKEKRILITEMTRPELVPFFSKLSGIVTDEGGLLCHASIVAREYKLPCVVGTNSATRLLKDEDEIELDAESGTIKKLNH